MQEFIYQAKKEWLDPQLVQDIFDWAVENVYPKQSSFHYNVKVDKLLMNIRRMYTKVWGTREDWNRLLDETSFYIR